MNEIIDWEAIVSKGAAWLDEEKPNWHNSIDLGDLDMQSSDLCVLGQVFEDMDGYTSGYGYAFEMIAQEMGTNDPRSTGRWMHEHGFVTHQDYLRDEAGRITESFIDYLKRTAQGWTELTEAWVDLIIERQGV